jgi:sugar/nucleoside kinase (ribokinase family)
MLVVLCDLIIDINMHLPSFPIKAGDVHRLDFLDIGPGGAANIAIMSARFGIPVNCLGEIGSDIFGKVIFDELQDEGIATDLILVEPGASTPMAGVIVDRTAEPAYVGRGGGLDLDHLPQSWHQRIQSAQIIFADGWAEHAGVPQTILAGFRLAQAAGVKVFFDPGPGNPDLPDDWIYEAIQATDVLLVNQEEAIRFSGLEDPVQAADHFLSMGPEMVVTKQGQEGILIHNGTEIHHSPAFEVKAVDQTGAGDSTTGAIIYGWLNSLSLQELGTIANAAGAAKVKKRGTGKNLPHLAEIREILIDNQQNPDLLP